MDVLRDAGVERYTEAIKICLVDPDVEWDIGHFYPQDAAQPDELASAVAHIANDAWKPIITSWMGGRDVQDGREIFLENNIPIYETPEEAVKTYLYMYSYERNLELLYETPADLPVDQAPPKNSLKALIKKVAATDRLLLTEEEAEGSQQLWYTHQQELSGTTRRTSRKHGKNDRVPAGAQDCLTRYHLQKRCGGRYHRYKFGGGTPGRVRKAYKKGWAELPGRKDSRCHRSKDDGKNRLRDHFGGEEDADFGSVILFGMGGMDVEIFGDFSVGLPPLNQTLSRRLMEETKVYRLLQGHRGKPPADLKQLEQIIVSFSNLIVDFPETLKWTSTRLPCVMVMPVHWMPKL